MNWFYWDTAWSLFFSLIWFMTITRNPDARITDAHMRGASSDNNATS
jgi:hypothetical protein